MIDSRFFPLPFVALSLLAVSACGGGSSPKSEDPDAGVPAVIEDGGGGIEDPPDGETLCGQGDCNYQTNSGCSAGEACRPALENNQAIARCQPAGTRAAGGSCSDSSECASGTLCAAGQCRTQCCGGDWSACPSGESCIRQYQLGLPGGGSVAADVDLCFPVGTCSVLDPSGCSSEENRTCQLVDPTGAQACAPAGTATTGAKCSKQQPCVAMHACVGGRCTPLCEAKQPESPTDPRPCADPEQSCVHFDRDPPGVGECTLLN
ncbi:MAG: hypothetical protein H6718_09110 [Polyangiaceae bacterium]|nr:hypothetical protein [Myxococcales bacterium]MCB9585545.1 hypothetical protein [Polyangiaceae bacterium]MCB9606439.1 hypothetical protein [Polyangiaceae bacterium]